MNHRAISRYIGLSSVVFVARNSIRFIVVVGLKLSDVFRI
jgi:hypothetical protein